MRILIHALPYTCPYTQPYTCTYIYIRVYIHMHMRIHNLIYTIMFLRATTVGTACQAPGTCNHIWITIFCQVSHLWFCIGRSHGATRTSTHKRTRSRIHTKEPCGDRHMHNLMEICLSFPTLCQPLYIHVCTWRYGHEVSRTLRTTRISHPQKLRHLGGTRPWSSHSLVMLKTTSSRKVWYQELLCI